MHTVPHRYTHAHTQHAHARQRMHTHPRAHTHTVLHHYMRTPRRCHTLAHTHCPPHTHMHTTHACTHAHHHTFKSTRTHGVEVDVEQHIRDAGTGDGRGLGSSGSAYRRNTIATPLHAHYTHTAPLGHAHAARTHTPIPTHTPCTHMLPTHRTAHHCTHTRTHVHARKHMYAQTRCSV